MVSVVTCGTSIGVDNIVLEAYWLLDQELYDGLELKYSAKKSVIQIPVCAA